MKIEDKQFNHGAALMQVAEHERFTAINELKINGEKSNTAFLVNDDIALYPKYCTKVKGAAKEYLFNFTAENIQELNEIANRYPKTCIPLICVAGRQICGMTIDDFNELRTRRVKDVGFEEDVISILVVIPSGSFRVYVNASGKKNTILGKPILIPQNMFPDLLFRTPFSSRQTRKT